MKKLGFGLMRLPLVNDDFSQPDKAQLCDMVDLFLAKGFQYPVRGAPIVSTNAQKT